MSREVCTNRTSVITGEGENREPYGQRGTGPAAGGGPRGRVPALPVLASSRGAAYGFSLGRNRLAAHKGDKTDAVTRRLGGKGGQGNTDRFGKGTVNLEEARAPWQTEAPKRVAAASAQRRSPETVGDSRSTRRVGTVLPARAQRILWKRTSGASAQITGGGSDGRLEIGAPESLTRVVPTPRLEKPPRTPERRDV